MQIPLGAPTKTFIIRRYETNYADPKFRLGSIRFIYKGFKSM